MESNRIDAFARSLATLGTRRGLLGALTSLLLAGALSSHRSDHIEAAGGRKRRKKRRKKQCAKAGQARKGRKRCCKRLVEDASGKCCRPDSPTTTCGDQTCGTAINNCGREIACTGCTGCCDGNVCHIDDNAACGSGGGACEDCLSSDSLCHNGTCQACDVLCAQGNAEDCGDDLQTQLDEGGPATVFVCPGLYQGNFTISRAVTVIGAGQGDDDAVDTILDANDSGQVVTIPNGTTATIELEDLRVRNGVSSSGGGGIRHVGKTLQLRNSTVIKNSATGGSGGGIYVSSASTLEAEDCTIRENSTGGIDDGGGIVTYGTSTLTDCIVEENHAANIGGGMYIHQFATATLAGATVIQGNTATFGGGFFTNQGTLNVGASCLFTENNAGGIDSSGGTVNLAAGALVCGNVSYQCAGFSDPDACLEVCPSA